MGVSGGHWRVALWAEAVGEYRGGFEAHVRKSQLQKFTFDYYMHGIVEESGEVFHAVRAALSTDAYSFDKDNVIAEIGDVLWYVTSFSMEFGESMSLPQTWPWMEKTDAEKKTPVVQGEIEGQHHDVQREHDDGDHGHGGLDDDELQRAALAAGHECDVELHFLEAAQRRRVRHGLGVGDGHLAHARVLAAQVRQHHL